MNYPDPKERQFARSTEDVGTQEPRPLFVLYSAYSGDNKLVLEDDCPGPIIPFPEVTWGWSRDALLRF